MNYLEAKAAFDKAKGAVILRKLGEQNYAVLRVADLTRGIVTDQYARFERLEDGNYRRTR